MKRLVATRSIVISKLYSTIDLIDKTNRYVSNDEKELIRIKNRLSRSSRPETMAQIFNDLCEYANRLGYHPPKRPTHAKMREKINQYLKHLHFLRVNANNQAVISLCVIYEDFVRRIIMKYFEEDIRRLSNEKETMKNHQIVEAITRGDIMHRTLANNAADRIMYGSVSSWFKSLKETLKLNVVESKALNEIFLVRNCLVHNNAKVSSQLYQCNNAKYTFRGRIQISFQDVKDFQDIIHKSFTFILNDFNRQYPTIRGTWVK